MPERLTVRKARVSFGHKSKVESISCITSTKDWYLFSETELELRDLLCRSSSVRKTNHERLVGTIFVGRLEAFNAVLEPTTDLIALHEELVGTILISRFDAGRAVLEPTTSLVELHEGLAGTILLGRLNTVKAVVEPTTLPIALHEGLVGTLFVGQLDAVKAVVISTIDLIILHEGLVGTLLVGRLDAIHTLVGSSTSNGTLSCHLYTLSVVHRLQDDHRLRMHKYSHPWIDKNVTYF